MPVSRSRADSTEEFESVGGRRSGYLLRLYIAGAAPRSTRAVRNIQRICDKYLGGHYELEVVDLYQQPGRASEGQVLAAPTLVREEPSPQRCVVGDLSDEQRVLVGLGLSGTA